MLATNSILNSNQIEEVEFSHKNASDETTTERERRSRSRTSSITARRKAEEKLKTWHYNGTRKTVEGSLNVSSLLVPSSPFANVSSLRERRGLLLRSESFPRGIRAEVDNRLSRIRNYVVILYYTLLHLHKMQFKGIMSGDYPLYFFFLSKEEERRCRIEDVS